MSLGELYHWQRAVRMAFGFLGCWQVLGLAIYSYGVVLARQCAAAAGQCAHRLAVLLPGVEPVGLEPLQRAALDLAGG